MRCLMFMLVFAGVSTASERPNVLFLISDDLNCDIGCYGHPTVRTPHIDKLAATGMRFDRAYVQYPVCNPSRTSFLTGLRPTTTKILSNTVHFRSRLPDAVTMPQLFRNNGYETISLGKVFHRMGADGKKDGVDDPASFDRFFDGKATAEGRRGEGRNLTEGKLAWCRWQAAEGTDADQADGQIADEAVKILSAKRDKPLFLAVGFHCPHDPFIAPKKYFEPYALDKLSLPAKPEGYKLPYPFSLGGGASKDAFDLFQDKEKREFMAAYYAGVSFMDAQVGKVLAALEAAKLADNTIVVLIGDHGYELGVRDWWNKATLFERSCRAPLILRVPGHKANGTPIRTIVEFIALYPTLAEACKLPGVPASVEGRSLVKLLDNPAAYHKQAAVTVVERGKFMGVSLRTDRYRYTEWDGGAKGAELYDHTTDPGEWKNLAGDPGMAKQVGELQLFLKSIH